MRMIRKAVVSVGAAALAVLAGCSDHKAPPIEQLDLVSRFFDNVRRHDFETAALQGRKIYAMDRNNEFLLHLITIHESNTFLRNAQKELNSGNVDGALRILEEGSRKYPENHTLRMYCTKVSQLRNAKSLIAAMENARGEAAMSASLTAAETGLGANVSPKLGKYFKNYEERIKKAAKESEKESRHFEINDGGKIKNGKKSPPAEPKVKLPPSRIGKKNAGRKGVTPPKGQESLERPAPIVTPESENEL